ncbi:hypothetical protein F5884DRAFT_269507 [Xylogone sp. PMI_703]|nr:hypothetical protein F5884DRAFT_269507 [Xylogone sp. PMI_703]
MTLLMRQCKLKFSVQDWPLRLWHIPTIFGFVMIAKGELLVSLFNLYVACCVLQQVVASFGTPHYLFRLFLVATLSVAGPVIHIRRNHKNTVVSGKYVIVIHLKEFSGGGSSLGGVYSSGSIQNSMLGIPVTVIVRSCIKQGLS